MKIKGKPLMLDGQRVLVLSVKVLPGMHWELSCVNVDTGKFFTGDVDKGGMLQYGLTPEVEYGLTMPNE